MADTAATISIGIDIQQLNTLTRLNDSLVALTTVYAKFLRVNSEFGSNFNLAAKIKDFGESTQEDQLRVMNFVKSLNMLDTTAGSLEKAFKSNTGSIKEFGSSIAKALGQGDAEIVNFEGDLTEFLALMQKVTGLHPENFTQALRAAGLVGGTGGMAGTFKESAPIAKSLAASMATDVGYIKSEIIPRLGGEAEKAFKALKPGDVFDLAAYLPEIKSKGAQKADAGTFAGRKLEDTIPTMKIIRTETGKLADAQVLLGDTYEIQNAKIISSEKHVASAAEQAAAAVTDSAKSQTAAASTAASSSSNSVRIQSSSIKAITSAIGKLIGALKELSNTIKVAYGIINSEAKKSAKTVQQASATVENAVEAPQAAIKDTTSTVERATEAQSAAYEELSQEAWAYTKNLTAVNEKVAAASTELLRVQNDINRLERKANSTRNAQARAALKEREAILRQDLAGLFRLRDAIVEIGPIRAPSIRPPVIQTPNQLPMLPAGPVPQAPLQLMSGIPQVDARINQSMGHALTSAQRLAVASKESANTTVQSLKKIPPAALSVQEAWAGIGNKAMEPVRLFGKAINLMVKMTKDGIKGVNEAAAKMTLGERIRNEERRLDAIFRAGFRLKMVGMDMQYTGRRITSTAEEMIRVYAEFEQTAIKAATALGGFGLQTSSITGNLKSAAQLDEEFTQLKESILGAAMEVRYFSADDMAKALYFYGSTVGQTVKNVDDLRDSFNALIPAMKVSALTGTSFESVIKGVYSVVAQFKPEIIAMQNTSLLTKEMAKTTEILFYLANKSAAEFPDLINSFKMVGPVAQQAGASFEDLAEILGVLADIGIKGTMAGRGMRQMFIQMSRPSPKAKKEIEGLFNLVAQQSDYYRKKYGGKSYTDIFFPKGEFKGTAQYIYQLADALRSVDQAYKSTVLNTISTANELPIITSLVNEQIRAFDNLRKSVKDDTKFEELLSSGAVKPITKFTDIALQATGAVEIGWTALQNSASYALAGIERSTEILKITIGDSISEGLIPFFNQVTDIIMNVRAWALANSDLVKNIGTAISIFGAASVAIGTLLIAIGGLVGVAAAAKLVLTAFFPVLGVIAGAVGVLVGVFIAFIQRFDEIQKHAQALQSNLSTAFTNIKNDSNGLMDGLKEAFSPLLDLGNSVVDMLISLTDGLSSLTSAANEGGNQLGILVGILKLLSYYFGQKLIMEILKTIGAIKLFRAAFIGFPETINATTGATIAARASWVSLIASAVSGGTAFTRVANVIKLGLRGIWVALGPVGIAIIAAFTAFEVVLPWIEDMDKSVSKLNEKLKETSTMFSDIAVQSQMQRTAKSFGTAIAPNVQFAPEPGTKTETQKIIDSYSSGPTSGPESYIPGTEKIVGGKGLPSFNMLGGEMGFQQQLATLIQSTVTDTSYLDPFTNKIISDRSYNAKQARDILSTYITNYKDYFKDGDIAYLNQLISEKEQEIGDSNAAALTLADEFLQYVNTSYADFSQGLLESTNTQYQSISLDEYAKITAAVQANLPAASTGKITPEAIMSVVNEIAKQYAASGGVMSSSQIMDAVNSAVSKIPALGESGKIGYDLAKSFYVAIFGSAPEPSQIAIDEAKKNTEFYDKWSPWFTQLEDAVRKNDTDAIDKIIHQSGYIVQYGPNAGTYMLGGSDIIAALMEAVQKPDAPDKVKVLWDALLQRYRTMLPADAGDPEAMGQEISDIAFLPIANAFRSIRTAVDNYWLGKRQEAVAIIQGPFEAVSTALVDYLDAGLSSVEKNKKLNILVDALKQSKSGIIQSIKLGILDVSQIPGDVKTAIIDAAKLADAETGGSMATELETLFGATEDAVKKPIDMISETLDNLIASWRDAKFGLSNKADMIMSIIGSTFDEVYIAPLGLNAQIAISNDEMGRRLATALSTLSASDRITLGFGEDRLQELQDTNAGFSEVWSRIKIEEQKLGDALTNIYEEPSKILDNILNKPSKQLDSLTSLVKNYGELPSNLKTSVNMGSLYANLIIGDIRRQTVELNGKSYPLEGALFEAINHNSDSAAKAISDTFGPSGLDFLKKVVQLLDENNIKIKSSPEARSAFKQIAQATNPLDIFGITGKQIENQYKVDSPQLKNLAIRQGMIPQIGPLPVPTPEEWYKQYLATNVAGKTIYEWKKLGTDWTKLVIQGDMAAAVEGIATGIEQSGKVSIPSPDAVSLTGSGRPMLDTSLGTYFDKWFSPSELRKGLFDEAGQWVDNTVAYILRTKSPTNAAEEFIRATITKITNIADAKNLKPDYIYNQLLTIFSNYVPSGQDLTLKELYMQGKDLSQYIGEWGSQQIADGIFATQVDIGAWSKPIEDAASTVTREMRNSAVESFMSGISSKSDWAQAIKDANKKGSIVENIRDTFKNARKLASLVKNNAGSMTAYTAPVIELMNNMSAVFTTTINPATRRKYIREISAGVKHQKGVIRSIIKQAMIGLEKEGVITKQELYRMFPGLKPKPDAAAPYLGFLQEFLPSGKIDIPVDVSVNPVSNAIISVAEEAAADVNVKSAFESLGQSTAKSQFDAFTSAWAGYLGITPGVDTSGAKPGSENQSKPGFAGTPSMYRASTKTWSAIKDSAPGNANKLVTIISSAIQKSQLWGSSGHSIGLAWGTGWAKGARDGVNTALISIRATTQGFSPPKKGPLRTIDRGGHNIGKAWGGAFHAAAVDSIHRGAKEVRRTLDAQNNDFAHRGSMDMSLTHNSKKQIQISLNVTGDGSANRATMSELRKGLMDALIMADLEHMVEVI